MNELTRVDLRWHNGQPAIHVWTADGQQHIRTLTPREALAIIRRLTGYLAVLFQHPTGADRTAETIAANPDMDWLEPRKVTHEVA